MRKGWKNNNANFNYYSYNNQVIKYNDIEELTAIPEEIACVRHYTWLNDAIGKRKVAYQQKHFGKLRNEQKKRNGKTLRPNLVKMCGPKHKN